MNNGGMMKGICVGLMSGMIGEKMMDNTKIKKPMKKKMNKAIHAMEEMVDTASYMFK